VTKRLLIALALAGLAGATLASEVERRRCGHEVQACLDKMAAALAERGWCGIELERDAETGRLTVRRVLPDSPAASAGIRAGDLLLGLEGVRLAGADEETLHRVYQGMRPGKKVTYTLVRNGGERRIAVTLAHLPAEMLSLYVGRHMLRHADVDPRER
jgi:S1-C subfamily serine protease